ncbi:hypothetical protein J4Q44_G00345320 [Coregonus suidteri]|uniref:Radial spoke head protein 9 homolog n=1 Tax=Coregonus suidteri TaxID=861788 RepID=A0AAN8KUT8_9TELE
MSTQRQREGDEAMEEDVMMGTSIKVNEEKRLPTTVHTIDKEVSVVPCGTFIKSPHGLVQTNRNFEGKATVQSQSSSEAGKLSCFLHFTEPQNLKKKSILEMADLDPSINFLDPLSEDIPKGLWSLQFERHSTVCVISSMPWLGMTTFKRTHDPPAGIHLHGRRTQ